MTIRYYVLLAALATAARADFSYTMTQTSGPGATSSKPTKFFYKGQKLRIDNAANTTIMDFDAQTVTTLNPSQHTYTVQKFNEEMGGAASGNEFQADVKETGQKKTINGYSANQVVMTMQIENPQLKQQGMSMTVEVEIWLSTDIPGGAELRAFYSRNLAKYPWMATSQGANPSMRAAMANLQKKIAQMNGVPVEEIVHTKMGGGAAQQAQSDPRMAQARAQLEEMAKQGGARGDAAQKALARMGGAASGAGGADITMDG